MAPPPENEPSSRLPTIYSTGSDRSTAREELAVERARLLFGSYRKTDANDPDTYVAMIAATLASYQEWVILEATHPRTGIQFTDKFKTWPPNPGELKEFCDDLSKRAARYAIYDKLPKPNVAPWQPASLAPRLPPSDRDKRPSLRELAERHADMAWAQRILNGSQTEKEPRKSGFRPLSEIMSECDVTQEQINAIPASPPRKTG